MDEMIITSEVSLVQFLSSRFIPSQAFPPSQSLVRNCIPLSDHEWQPLHSVHELQPVTQTV